MRFRGPWKGDHESELPAYLCDKGALDSTPLKKLPFLLTPSSAVLIIIVRGLGRCRILNREKDIKY